MSRADIIFSDSQIELKANNWYFSQNVAFDSKLISDFPGRLRVSSSPRITASWPAGMNMVSRAITLTCSVKGSEGALRLWNKGTVWEIGNLSCIPEKRASQWLLSRKSKPRQSASEDFNTKNCCRYPLLAIDIGNDAMPETSFSAWIAAKSRRWAGWTGFGRWQEVSKAVG